MSTYSIDLQCPQCGAPVVLQETERIVACEYCRVRHIIVSGRHQSYCLAPKQETTPDNILYVPYWRFKGMAFALDQNRVLHRLIDSSAQAIENAGIPFSLGLRSQTQRLQQITPKSPGKFLIPTTSSKTIIQRMNERLLGQGARVKADSLTQAHVGEVVSLIYTPVLLGRNGLQDGITGRTYSSQALELAHEQISPEPPANLTFLPVLCPYCGWDLQGENTSLCLRCSNCCSLWTGYKGKLIQIPFRFYGHPRSDQVYLPFWWFEVRAEGLSLSACLGLDWNSGASPEKKGQSLSFKIPAFKIRPGLFLRLSRQMTPASAEGTRPDNYPKASYYPANLPFQEGFQSLPMLICQLSRNKERFAQEFPQARLKPQRVRLLFVPFTSRGSDLVQLDQTIGLQKNALAIGRLL